MNTEYRTTLLIFQQSGVCFVLQVAQAGTPKIEVNFRPTLIAVERVTSVLSCVEQQQQTGSSSVRPSPSSFVFSRTPRDKFLRFCQRLVPFPRTILSADLHKHVENLHVPTVAYAAMLKKKAQADV